MLGMVGPGDYPLPSVRDFRETTLLPSLVPKWANIGNKSALVVLQL